MLILWKVPETLPVSSSHERGGLRTPLTDRVFLPFVGLTPVLAVLSTQMSTMLPLAMRADQLRTSAYPLRGTKQRNPKSLVFALVVGWVDRAASCPPE